MIQPLTISNSLAWAIEVLNDKGTSRLDSELLLGHCCQLERTRMITEPDYCLSQAQWQQFQEMISARAEGMPVAYLLGEKEFWSLKLKVTSETLVPRPETETLIEHAVQLLSGIAKPKILELGTGSGAIALALASERPDAVVHAIDQSDASLRMATQNLERLGFTNVTMWQSDWFTSVVDHDYDLIISNPPYLAEDDPHLEALSFEPRGALVSANNGLADLAYIIGNARKFLKEKGWLMLEHGSEQGAAIAQLMHKKQWQHIAQHNDLAGHQRITMGQLVL